MPCDLDIVPYRRVNDGAHFDLCISGNATWAGDAKIICSEPQTPNGMFTAAQMRTPCGQPGGARLVVSTGCVYVVEIRIAVTGNGSLKICHSITHNGKKHTQSCCWELNVQAQEKVVRWANILVKGGGA